MKGRSKRLATNVYRGHISTVLWFGFVIRLVLAPLNLGFSSDIGLFSYWAQEGAKDLLHIYSNASFLDYPPFYIYILTIIGLIGKLFGISGGDPVFVILLKLPSILADLATAYILYSLAKKRFSGSWPVAIAALYIFNPAVLIDSAMWGQVDSFMVMLIALGFYTLMESDRPALCGLPFAAAILTKPQALIVMPAVLFTILKGRDPKFLLRTLFYGAGALLALALPFLIVEGPSWLIELYLNTAGHYTYASLNAFNLFSMLGANLVQDSETFIFFSYKIWGFAFILLTLLYTGLVFIKGKGSQLPYLGGILLYLGVFVLSARMHERYMFPVLFFFLVIFILTRDRWSLIFYGISSITIFANIYVVLEKMIRTGDPHIYMNDGAYADTAALIIVSIVNVLLLIAVVIWAWRNGVMEKISRADDIDKISPRQDMAGKKRPRPEEIDQTRSRINKKDLIIMTVMTLIYLGMAFINLGGFEVPQTEWVAKDSTDGFIIELEEENYVSRLTYYCGLGKEATYRVWYKSTNGEYEKIEDLMEEDEFYKWKVLNIDAHLSHIMVRPTKPGGSIHEIGVFATDKNQPLAISITDLDGNPVDQSDPLYNLVDEQAIAKYTHNYKTGTYFDEIYHARTAYEHLNQIKPYEWTHPPLGKILIGIGIKAFGMNTFGWRFVGTIIGAAMIPLMYLFGKKLFKRSLFGFCAAFLMMFDLMHFAQTRIATIDSYTTFFVILMYYFMADYYLCRSYKKGFIRSLIPLFLSGLFFGLGAASKWSALYGAPGLALIFFMAKYNETKDYREYKKMDEQDRPAWVKSFIGKYWVGTLIACVFFFIIIPAAIYLLSYIPYLRVEGMTFKDILDYQTRMYNYHSGLEATHGFQSSWWTWPLLIRPIWYYKAPDMAAGMASTISSFGNPAIWWVGIGAYFYLIKRALKKNSVAIFLLIPIITQLLPWTQISRAAFIYHFFPILPFVMLGIVFAIKCLIDLGMSQNRVYVYLAIVLINFILFYPMVSALLVPEYYLLGLELLPSWVFWT